MRVRGLVTTAALIVGGVATVGSSTVAATADGSSAAIPPSVVNVAGESAPQFGYLPPAGFVAPEPRTARSQRAAPAGPTPLPRAGAPLAPPGSTAPVDISGLIAAPVVLSSLGIPEIVLNAYRGAELQMMVEQPRCGLPWHLLAGIGRIESGHAGGGKTDSLGTTVTPILGPVLDGSLSGNEVITDTDRGMTDGDPKHDRAVGPMQFIPATWANYASDGNADGIADPNNVFDAALASARYLCAGDLDLREPAQEMRAVLRYNNSGKYAADVITWSNAYKNGGTPTPDQTPGGTPTPQLVDSVTGENTPPGNPTAPPPVPPGAQIPDMPIPGAPAPPVPPGQQAPVVPGLPQLPPLPCVLFCAPPPVNETADTPRREGNPPTPVA